MPAIAIIFIIGVIMAIVIGFVMSRKYNMVVGIIATACTIIISIVATSRMTLRTN